jgi:signal transduction histidine kinase
VVPDEQQRLAALREYRVLDTPAGGELEAVVRVAAMVAGVPTATLNLIDEHRQCQLTTAGFTGGDSARSDSMCAVRLPAAEFVHVRDNPWVTGATVRVTTPPATLTCDPTLLRQLLQNLIGNAVKYRDPDRDCRVEVCARWAAGEWVVTVSDNGIGIPAGHRRRVFEMFARIEPGGHVGHGVGLSTCERIVTRHGGRIWADTAHGGGTAVSFTLPGA